MRCKLRQREREVAVALGLDIRLALATGRSEHVPLPSAAVADELLTRASKLGHKNRDIAALYDVLAQTAAEQGGEL